MWTAVELRELRIFLILAEELHFGRTAARLQISQSGVSEAIRGLEARLGGRLFERTSRRVSLTPAGRELERSIAPIVADLQGALARVSDLAGGLGGLLHVGFTATTHGPPLSRLTARFESGHPGCQVVLHEVDHADPYGPLRGGDIDALINWLAVDEVDLTAGPVISLHDRLLAVASGHRLASRTSVRFEDLAGEQVALMPPPFPDALYDAILPPRTPSGRPIARTLVVRGAGEIAVQVALGKIVHITMAGIAVFARPDIAFIPVSDLAPIPLGLIWSTARHNAKIRALADTARALSPLRVTHSPATSGM